MLKTYRYRLKPTKSQVTILERQLELCRFVYNDTLAYRKNAWELEQRAVKRFETQDRLPQLKLEVPQNSRMSIHWFFRMWLLGWNLRSKRSSEGPRQEKNPVIQGSKERIDSIVSLTPSPVLSWILKCSISPRLEISRSSYIGRLKVRLRPALFAECQLANGSLASPLIWAKWHCLHGKMDL